MPKYIKPTLRTKFHIDFNWWDDGKQNLHQALIDQLCEEIKASIEADPDIKTLDWIDPETAQVYSVDQLWHVVRAQCSHKPDFLTDELPLVTAIFRLFIKNNNAPLTPSEIHQHLQRKSSQLILRTIGGRKTYLGIRTVTPLV